MEQNIQEQTPRHHRYHLRCDFSASGQGACIIFSGHKEAPLEPEDVQAFLALHKKDAAHVELFYHIPSSLTHYGKVDSLVTAGAMADFVEYVQKQEVEEAKAFFAALAAHVPKALEEIYIVREPKDWEKALKVLGKAYAKIGQFAPIAGLCD